MVRPAIVARGGGKYCSNTCRGVGIRTHGEGMTSPEYRTWSAIKRRCFNPAEIGYANYGARGITVCDKWRNSFPAFLAEVGRKPTPKHTLDRIDNNMGYAPGNVRWATMAEQNRNRRDNVFLTHGGETHCMRDWEGLLGMAPGTLHQRLKMGWSADRALTTPRRHHL